jgi:hypothetical protein
MAYIIINAVAEAEFFYFWWILPPLNIDSRTGYDI